MVDLTELRPGGENGGVKPFIFEYLAWLTQREHERLRVTFLTASCSHGDVRTLARAWDNLICVRDSTGTGAVTTRGWRAREWVYFNPPSSLAYEIDADLTYSPFGSPQFICPGVPTIATVVDLLHRDYPASLRPGEAAYREKLYAELAESADLFQCISEYTGSQLQKCYGIPAARILRTYIAVHDRLERQAALQSSSAANARVSSHPYFLYPANSWRHKNHRTLLVAYRLYRQQAGAAPWDLVLTGHDDEGMQEILAAADSLGLANHVRYQGHLSEGEFAELWRNAGALVFPSLHEGFGIPLVEAMHFRVPIVCSDVTSLPEIAGGAALLADARRPEIFAAALARIAADADLRADLVQRGADQLARFSIEREGEAFLAACRSLIGARTAKRHRGWYVDGWTCPMACFSVPLHHGPISVEARFAPMPVGRMIRFYNGCIPLGGFRLEAAKPTLVRFRFEPGKSALVMHTVDASKLSTEDHRIHGVRLEEIRIVDSDGLQEILSPAAA